MQTWLFEGVFLTSFVSINTLDFLFPFLVIICRGSTRSHPEHGR